MNKELLDQLPPDEQPAAVRLSSAAEEMHLSSVFQWKLENELREAYPSKKEGKQQSPLIKFLVPAGWVVLAFCGVLLLNWILRTLLPHVQVAAGPAPTQAATFETGVRAGNICKTTLAVAHGFDVFLSNPDKTGFISVDEGNAIGELRSFDWSSDGKQIAILGNTTGSGNIYIVDPANGQLKPLLTPGQLGYMMEAAWSRDGKHIAMWSPQNNKVLYLLKADGTGLTEKQLDTQILGTPQFAPDGKSIVFYGADASSSGLFSVRLEDLQTKMISATVEDETSFAFSPDGSRLAYMEMDRASGGAILMVQDLDTRAITTLLGSLPIPKGSGSSIPNARNLSWSSDGRSLVFDFGRGANDRVIYLAHTDGTGLIKVVDTGYAPAISGDGRCLAYINNKQVFFLDLSRVPSGTATTPLLLADLPPGRAIADYRLDKLQWQP